MGHPKKQYPVGKLLLLGLIFHLVYIGSVFDCYFTSPVVHGMKRFKTESAHAKRLVLIVGDGLRADLLLSLKPFPNVPESPEVVAPYLRSIVETRGAFGISHTRVPTESRPGHVALIGGMYEDVSAVTRGWKTNPVHFDSVFNQSSHTYSFGSPDILPMFGQGATPGKVDMWCYHEDEEDFTKDATHLDTWVLDHLQSLLHNATTDDDLNQQLREEKTVFFLHLLGLDTTGHSYRPHSKEYMTNIQVVDTIVKHTEALFSEFYGDEETAFVFTADHGMSVIGNHGDGDPDNTRTPLIAWGAGVRGPLPDSTPSSHDEYTGAWGLTHLLRHDVEQADIAALMSALIGVEWPINSVGVIPDVDHTRPGYLSGSEKVQAEAAVVNAKVILEHYRVKHELKKSHALFYKPYPYFVQDGDISDSPGDFQLEGIEALFRGHRYNDVRQLSADFIKHTLAGLRYLETYDRTLIRTIVIFAYLGWIAYSAAHFLPQVKPSHHLLINVASAITFIVSCSFFWLQHSPATLYLYIVFPIYFWHQSLSRLADYFDYLMDTGKPGPLVFGSGFVYAGFAVLALEGMVIGYTHRSVWGIGFAVIGVLWPLFWPSRAASENWKTLLAWVIVCLGTAVFPLLSVDKQENIPMVLSGGAWMVVIGLIGAYRVPDDKSHAGLRLFIWVQTGLIAASMVIAASSAANLKAKLGLPLPNQIAGWVILVLASILPLAPSLGRVEPSFRILTLFLGFSVCFVMLSISVEGLFFCSYTTTLAVWSEVEAMARQYSGRGDKKQQQGELQLEDIRIAVFFLFFVQVAFFGTGNVASISSFYLEPVYRLVPIFNPFLMAALLIFKIVAPYVMLSVFFARLNARLALPPFSLFLIALTITDVMTMTFFFKVTDTGSWLEIGQTISFFCISSMLLVWSAGICALGDRLLAGTKTESIHSKAE
ncbi:Phosphatidylinositolglycan class N-domain-containing protein [Irpex rosettiformis]|uniref:Phosphatidylinositolglycan class N-domain-containing protein n=1 Tax=Irpex rosettiformis TaxID=378272 RepID=A0ACB8TR09_9APHY|nr:Phosphatidylinositolglycan class N-domain-containing protein [Irpex rosettiformis]